MGTNFKKWKDQALNENEIALSEDCLVRINKLHDDLVDLITDLKAFQDRQTNLCIEFDSLINDFKASHKQ